VHGACCLALVVACGVYYRQLWPAYADFSRSIDPSCMVTYCDFTLFYYKQSQQIAEQDRPIKKYFYSPTFALLLRPIGHLDKQTAWRVWTCVQALSLLLMVVASMLTLRDRPRWTQLLVLSLTLTSYPVLHNWKWGQANTTFIALVVLAVAQGERGRDWLSGFAVALAAASRYYPIIYGIGFLAPRRAGTLVWCAVALAALLVVWPACFMGPARAWHFYVSSADAMKEATETWVSQSPASQYLPTVVHRLAAKWHLKKEFGPRDVWVKGAYGLAACHCVLALWAGYRRVPHRALWAFCLIALSTPWLMPTSWMHYFVYLPLVQTFLAAELVRVHIALPLRIVVCLLAWLPSVALSSVFVFLFTSGAKAYAWYGFLLAPNTLLSICAYVTLPLSASSSQRGTSQSAAKMAGDIRRAPAGEPR
jgi:hypothetical protein